MLDAGCLKLETGYLKLDSFELNNHTLQPITASLEAEGLMGEGNRAVQLFKEKHE